MWGGVSSAAEHSKGCTKQMANGEALRSRRSLQQPKLRHQSIAPFHPLGVDGNAGHWTHLHALRLIEMTDAFGAFVGIDLVNLGPQKNSFVGALGLTHIAVDAFVCDHQGHESVSLG
jgi:hypothetical protein